MNISYKLLGRTREIGNQDRHRSDVVTTTFTASDRREKRQKDRVNYSEGDRMIRKEGTKKTVRSEVLTAKYMKTTVFWNVTPCSMVDIYRRFG
jgi:hypothetical protein